MASMAAAEPPSAVTTMTGKSARAGPSSARTSRPPRPGILRSRSTASGRFAIDPRQCFVPVARLEGLVPFGAEEQDQVAANRAIVVGYQNRGRTYPSEWFSVAGGRGGREGEREDGAGVLGAIGGAELAPVGQGNLAGDGQPQPGPLGLGRVERFEQVFESLGGQPGPGIGHAGLDRVTALCRAGSSAAGYRRASWPEGRWSSGCGRPAGAQTGPSSPVADRDRGRPRPRTPLASAAPGREPGGFGQHGIEIAGRQVLTVGA